MDIQAYRGSRALSVRREHSVPERLFTRMLSLASAYELHLLPTLDPYGPFELSKAQAWTLAEEVAFLKPVINDELLLPHFDALHELAVWCARSAEDSWIRIEGP